MQDQVSPEVVEASHLAHDLLEAVAMGEAYFADQMIDINRTENPSEVTGQVAVLAHVLVGWVAKATDSSEDAVRASLRLAMQLQ